MREKGGAEQQKKTCILAYNTERTSIGFVSITEY